MSIYLGENKIADNTCSRNIGEIIQSTLPLSDAGLHLLDGALISSTGSYTKFVNYIAGLYNQTAPSSVTYYAWFNSRQGVVYTKSTTPSVGDHYFNYYNGEMVDPYFEGSDFPYYVTSVNSNSIGVDGEDAYQYTRDSSIDITLTAQTPPPYFCSESDWQSSVSTYGVCGKFVYDSVNNTVRLPKITGFTEGTIDPTTLGDLTTAGLPNITGGYTSLMYPPSYQGAFYETYEATGKNTWGDGSFIDSGVGFDASRSSSIYGNSSTVQPQSIKVLYYIVIASSITNELNLDVADLERSKADVDLSNVDASGTSLASCWAMPSGNIANLTIGANGATYTAPANGYFQVGGHSNAAWGYIQLVGAGIDFTFQGATAGTWGRGFIPVKKGVSATLYYNEFNFEHFRFVYAEGEN